MIYNKIKYWVMRFSMFIRSGLIFVLLVGSVPSDAMLCVMLFASGLSGPGCNPRKSVPACSFLAVLKMFTSAGAAQLTSTCPVWKGLQPHLTSPSLALSGPSLFPKQCTNLSAPRLPMRTSKQTTRTLRGSAPPRASASAPWWPKPPGLGTNQRPMCFTRRGDGC